MQLGISCKTYKLLGLRIDDDDDLKWGTNTERIITKFIIYMTKLLQSDWLRGVQLFH